MKQQDFLICVPLNSSLEAHDILTLAALAQLIEKNGRSVWFYPYGPAANGDAAQGIDVDSCAVQDKAQQELIDAIKRAKLIFGIKTLFDLTPERIDSCYVVYPEAELDNPLNARQVIRYFLNRDGLATQGRKVNTGSGDFILARSKHAHPAVQHVSLVLPLSPMFNRADTLSAEQRQLDITYIGRGAQFGITEVLPDTVEITREWLGNDQQLAALLRNCRFFYTADALSPLNVEALACGAIPAFLDDIGPFTDADIDGSELGPLPRLSSQSNFSENFFAEFEAARVNWLERLSTHIAGQDANVAQMIARVEGHFGARIKVRPFLTEFGEVIERGNKPNSFYPYRRGEVLTDNNIPVILKRFSPRLALPRYAIDQGFSLHNLTNVPLSLPSGPLGPQQLASVVHAGECMANRMHVAEHGTYCVAAEFVPTTRNGDIFASVMANGRTVWQQKIEADSLHGRYVGYLTLPPDSTIDFTVNVQSTIRELCDTVGLRFAAFEYDPQTGILGARRDNLQPALDPREIAQWQSDSPLADRRVETIEAQSISLDQRTEMFLEGSPSTVIQSQFGRAPQEVVKSVLEQRGTEPAIRYAIFMTPRSGSTLLTEILSGTGKLGYPVEFFQSDWVRWLSPVFSDVFPKFEQLITQGFKSENGVFGVEIQDFLFAGEQQFFADLEQWRVIYLKRENLLAQAVSFARAHALKVWHHFGKAESRQETPIDRKTIIDAINMLLKMEQSFEQTFRERQIEPLVLSYEELIAAPPTQVARVAEHIGVTGLDFSGLDIGAATLQPTRRSINTLYELETMTNGGTFNGYDLHRVANGRYVAVLTGIDVSLLSLDTVTERAPVWFVANSEETLRSRLALYLGQAINAWQPVPSV